MTDEDAAKLPPNVWKAYCLGAYIAIKCGDLRPYQHAQGIAKGWDVEFDDSEVN